MSPIIGAISVLLLSSLVMAVDHRQFRTCSQTSFCQFNLRQNDKEIRDFIFEALQPDGHFKLTPLIPHPSPRPYEGRLQTIKDDILKVSIDIDWTAATVLQDLIPDHEIMDNKNKMVSLMRPQTEDNRIDAFLSTFSTSEWYTKVHNQPFSMEFISNGLQGVVLQDLRINPDGSVGIRVTFPGAHVLYGLAEHTDGLTLKDTRGNDGNGGDPYRLYNLDVFEYELNSRMALYGNIPLIIAHSPSQTVGILWHNPSETWVDIAISDTPTKSGTAQIVSDKGNVVLYIFRGPTLQDVVQQYHKLTGAPYFPPIAALGYHQSRWNYDDEEDVRMVDDHFDTYDIPYDVLWLDIEHTDGKRYLTWHPDKFPNPDQLIDFLEQQKGRHLVTIVDPHIKVDDDHYFVYQEIAQNRLAILSSPSSFNLFEGKCWPDQSVWVDFINPKGRQWWAELIAKYAKTQLIWNDMNEPSVFESPEVTMPKNAIHKYQQHLDGNNNNNNNRGEEEKEVVTIPHGYVHNAYGSLMHRSTFEGLLIRGGNNNQANRPFVLSRSFYAGSQQYGPIWTGDNQAEWSHLAATVPMLLSLSISGLPFVGADVGGFFGNPSPTLLVRWYQTAMWQPFFRGHSHQDSKRREPWMFGEPFTQLIRNAIIERYRILPYLYTLAFECSYYMKEESTKKKKYMGMMMRPMVIEWPNMPEIFGVDDQFMLGPAILHKPAIHEKNNEQAAVDVDLVLPPRTIWYHWTSGQMIMPHEEVVGRMSFRNISLKDSVTLVRGGYIIPTRPVIPGRRSSRAMRQDPLELIIAMDPSQNASGQLFVDDQYFPLSSPNVNGGDIKGLLIHLSYEKGILTVDPELINLTSDESLKLNVAMESVSFMGLMLNHKLNSSHVVVHRLTKPINLAKSGKYQIS